MIDRTHRVKQTAEIFTPPKLVNEMLDKLPDEVWEESKTFCDPACGDGNMLVEVLKRKLEKGHDPLKALCTIYGTDIMKDNIDECRERLWRIVLEKSVLTAEHIRVVVNNIRCTPISHYPNGSLDYDFSFKNNIRDESRLQKIADVLNND